MLLVDRVVGGSRVNCCWKFGRIEVVSGVAGWEVRLTQSNEWEDFPRMASEEMKCKKGVLKMCEGAIPRK
jgi:hypothetical protein